MHTDPRLIAILTLAFCAAAFSAGDKPPNSEIPGWGTLVDPGGDCHARADDGKLRIEVPGAYHDLWPDQMKVNAPRVLRDVQGDFTVTVKVSQLTPPQKGTVLPGLASSVPFHAGSLLVWLDERNFVRMDRAAMFSGDRMITFCYLHVFKDGKRQLQRSADVKDVPTQLRFQRQGKRLTASFSQDDGKTWHAIAAPMLDYPPGLKVGVAALNNTRDALTVTFESLQVDPAK